MNEMTHSLNPFKMRQAGAGAAVFHGPAQPRQRETTIRSQKAKSLASVMLEIRGTNRWEERVWCLMAFTASMVIAISLWI